MAKKPNLVDRLRVHNTISLQHETTLQDVIHTRKPLDVIHTRKPLDVNNELLEGNPNIELILQNTSDVLNEIDGNRSNTRFVVSAYEKHLKDKRFKDTQVHNKHLDI